MTIVRRIVRTVTRRVRQHSRSGDDGDSSDCDESSALFESLEKQTIEDVVVHPGNASSTSWFDHPQDVQHIDKELLLGLVELKKIEFQLETKKVEVDAQLDIKKVETEPDRLRADAEHLRAQATLLTAQTAAANTKKRMAPTPIDDHWLEISG